MNLQEVFDQLTYGELSQLSIGGGEAGVIDASNYARVLAHVNLGLTALYKRFPLKEGRLTFTLQAERTNYPLTTQEDVLFVEDPDTDFNDDILKITRIYTAGGEELSLNDLADPYSCFTPTVTLLRVPLAIAAQGTDLPEWLKTPTLQVVYRTKHTNIPYRVGFNPARVEVELPESHLEPLLLFVASRALTPLGTAQFEGLAGNNYYAKYEAACQAIENLDLRVDQDSQNSRLVNNGWA